MVAGPLDPTYQELGNKAGDPTEGIIESSAAPLGSAVGAARADAGPLAVDRSL